MKISQLSPEMARVRDSVDRLTEEAIGFYRDNPNFKVEDGRKNGEGLAVVSLDVYGGGDRRLFEKCQQIEYKYGSVVHVTSEMGSGNYFGFDPDGPAIRMGTYYSANGNAQVHTVDCTMDKEGNRLKESSRIQVYTDIELDYELVNDGERFGFQAAKALLHNYLPLTAEDTKKFLPDGRFVAVNDLVASVVDPYRSSRGFKRDKFPDLSDFEGFPRLEHFDTGRHLNTFVTTLERDEDKVFGMAHPLRDDPDAWLIFVRYKLGEKGVGRALVIRADRQSLQVSQVDGVPTIDVDVTVDGTPYHLKLPEPRVSPEKITEENRSKAKHIRKDEETGEERGWVPITTERLEATKEQYYGDVLNGALQEHYNEWIKTQKA